MGIYLYRQALIQYIYPREEAHLMKMRILDLSERERGEESGAENEIDEKIDSAYGPYWT